MKTKFDTKTNGRLSIALILLLAMTAFAQTTEFTYQGKLSDTGTPSATYDFEFRLCASETSCSTPLAIDSRPGVAVASGGIFTTKINFGAGAFDGADRFLEIAVRHPGETNYTTLAPRQKLASAPYAIQSLKAANALQLGGTAANQFVQTTDSRLDPNNFVQNTIAAQAGVNFNVGGTGTASVFNAATGFNINGSRILSAAGTNNLFAGVGAGSANTSGGGNSFFGKNAGLSNTTGGSNSFVGRSAGQANTTGFSNSFFGYSAGQVNTTGNYNSFFGDSAGVSNTTGNNNAFFGDSAGLSNMTGSSNAFFGTNAGSLTTSSDNAFFGSYSGQSNTTGSLNSFFGKDAGLSNTSATQNSFFGNAAGKVTTTGGGNSFFGYGAGNFNTTGRSNSFFGLFAGNNNTTGIANTFVGYGSGYSNTTGNSNTIIGTNANVVAGNLSNATAIGAGAYVTSSNTVVLGTGADTVRIPGNLVVTGSVAKGGGSFRIDHPLDPENKYLYHSFVESPDMMNIYNGNATTDANGDAVITLPDYFSALNRDFRYQLTVIGQFAQAIVHEKMNGNKFKIKTDKPKVEVSWQVTGIRKDKFAEDERIKVEENKPQDEKGKCLYAPACQSKSSAPLGSPK